MGSTFDHGRASPSGADALCRATISFSVLRESHLLMASLGYEHIWDTQRDRTGELLLIDTHAMRPISKLDQDDNAEQMIVALTRALAQVAVP